MSFSGSVVVITGATSGIGQQLALDLVARGAEVHGLGRDRARLDELEAAGVRTHAIDLGDEAAVRACFESFGAVDVLVHSAGVITLGTIAAAPIEELDHNYRVNLRAPVFVTHVLLDRIVAAKGQIVFVNSGAGLSAGAGWGHYAASKHGLKAIADALRAEVKPKGVRVMSIYPGRTATPMQERVRSLEGQDYDPSAYIQVKDVTSMIVGALVLPRTADVIDLNIRTGPG